MASMTIAPQSEHRGVAPRCGQRLQSLGFVRPSATITALAGRPGVSRHERFDARDAINGRRQVISCGPVTSDVEPSEYRDAILADEHDGNDARLFRLGSCINRIRFGRKRAFLPVAA